ncbi:hypothetical protein BRD15_07145, partial [Halobacteriales archaeon SW_6_65_15]
MATGTDGTIQQGRWAVDDLQIAGSRYTDNVAVLPNETDVERAPGETLTLDAEIANLGQSPRGDLAVAVSVENPSPTPGSYHQFQYDAANSGHAPGEGPASTP